MEGEEEDKPPCTTPCRRVRVAVRGRVQGVGFRFWTAQAAQTAGLGGWVRNLSDGSVEAEVEGPPDVVATLLDALRQGPWLAHVTGVFAVDVPPQNGRGFLITG